VYHPGLLGRVAAVLDTQLPAALYSMLRARTRAFRGKFRRVQPDDAGSRSRFFALELGSVTALDTSRTDVAFREIGPYECMQHPLRFGSSMQRVEQSLRRGDRCFAAYVDGDLAHHHWVSRDTAFLQCMLPHGLLNGRVAYPFDAYTYTAYRGRSLQAQTHLWLAERYRCEDVDRFVVRITATNEASIRGVLKAGYVEVRG
jgi:hypothetical protein